MESVWTAWTIRPATSLTWIQGITWSPDPIRPPTPRKKGIMVCWIIPPLRPSTTPDLRDTDLVLTEAGS